MALTPDEIDGLRELILAVYGPVTEELLRDLCRCGRGRRNRGHAAQTDGPHQRRGGSAHELGRGEDRAAGGK